MLASLSFEPFGTYTNSLETLPLSMHCQFGASHLRIARFVTSISVCGLLPFLFCTLSVCPYCPFSYLQHRSGGITPLIAFFVTCTINLEASLPLLPFLFPALSVWGNHPTNCPFCYLHYQSGGITHLIALFVTCTVSLGASPH